MIIRNCESSPLKVGHKLRHNFKIFVVMRKHQKSWSQEEKLTIVQYYKEYRSIRDIMKAFSIPSTTIVYNILTDNNVPFRVYKKVKEDSDNEVILTFARIA